MPDFATLFLIVSQVTLTGSLYSFEEAAMRGGTMNTSLELEEIFASDDDPVGVVDPASRIVAALLSRHEDSSLTGDLRFYVADDGTELPASSQLSLWPTGNVEIVR